MLIVNKIIFLLLVPNQIKVLKQSAEMGTLHQFSLKSAAAQFSTYCRITNHGGPNNTPPIPPALLENLHC